MISSKLKGSWLVTECNAIPRPFENASCRSLAKWRSKSWKVEELKSDKSSWNARLHWTVLSPDHAFFFLKKKPYLVMVKKERKSFDPAALSALINVKYFGQKCPRSLMLLHAFPFSWRPFLKGNSHAGPVLSPNMECSACPPHTNYYQSLMSTGLFFFLLRISDVRLYLDFGLGWSLKSHGSALLISPKGLLFFIQLSLSRGSFWLIFWHTSDAD